MLYLIFNIIKSNAIVPVINNKIFNFYGGIILLLNVVFMPVGVDF